MVSTTEVKELVINTLNLEDINPDEIQDDMPLFKEGLGLDSVDAIELMVMLDNKFKIKLENAETAKDVFASINALTAFINQNAK
ncbi:MAG: phosphopantetheine-binding protein [Campylobacterales bacterium]|nr:phosphopantetheine-binding protein [Campylobacterales bacterium]